MRGRWAVPALGGALVIVAAVAVALQGVPTFSAPRIPLPAAVVRSTSGPQTPATGTPEPSAPEHAIQIDLSWLAVALAALAVVVALGLVWRFLRRRMRLRAEQPTPALDAVLQADPPAAPEDAPRPEPVRRGLDRALDELGSPGDPRDAIERAWLGLEEGAADSGVRRLPAETPGEFVARVLGRVPADAHAARQLLDVYLRVRFGDRAVRPEDVRAAQAALQTLRASWSSAPTAGVAGRAGGGA